jgi:hypothetical protein
VTRDELAEALATLAVQAYRGKPPDNVLEALGVIVRLATEAKAVTPAKRASTRRMAKANGHDRDHARATQG